MAAVASSGTNQHLTLDDPSFEKLLEAAWVLQCLHDQLHPLVDRDEIEEPVVFQSRIESVSLGLPETIDPVVQPPPMVTIADSKPAVVGARSAEDEALAELVKTQAAIETGMLDLDATVKRLVSLSPNLASEPAPVELASVEPIAIKVTAVKLESVELTPSLPALSVAVPRPPNLPPSGKSHRVTKGRSRTRLHSVSKPPATVFGTLSLAIELRSAEIRACGRFAL